MQSINKVGLVTPRIVSICIISLFTLVFIWLIRAFPTAISQQLIQNLSLSSGQVINLSAGYFFFLFMWNHYCWNSI
jgi:hypothetical protein